MNKNIADYRLIETWSPRMGGVFSTSDLENLFNEGDPLLLNRRINSLIDAKALMRYIRGFYLAEQYDLEVLSQRIYPDAYISLGTVLARHLVIGSVPAKTVYAVKTGRNRAFSSPAGTLVYCGIAPRLVFGTEYRNAVRFASAEKAFLDTLYFYQKGFGFSFNIFEDIDLSRLNASVIKKWLGRYGNPKFVSFVKGVLSGGHT